MIQAFAIAAASLSLNLNGSILFDQNDCLNAGPFYANCLYPERTKVVINQIVRDRTPKVAEIVPYSVSIPFSYDCDATKPPRVIIQVGHEKRHIAAIGNQKVEFQISSEVKSYSVKIEVTKLTKFSQCSLSHQEALLLPRVDYIRLLSSYLLDLHLAISQLQKLLESASLNDEILATLVGTSDREGTLDIQIKRLKLLLQSTDEELTLGLTDEVRQLEHLKKELEGIRSNSMSGDSNATEFLNHFDDRSGDLRELGDYLSGEIARLQQSSPEIASELRAIHAKILEIE